MRSNEVVAMRSNDVAATCPKDAAAMVRDYAETKLRLG